ncbi:MAG: S8 family peptidase [Bacteroidota bacterium]
MRKILFLFYFIPVSLFAQPGESHETAFIRGEAMIQLEDKYSIDEVINDFPDSLNVKLIKQLSPNMRYWLLGFDSLILSNEKFIQLLLDTKGITLAQNNHFVYERSIPDDASFSSQWHHTNTGQTGGTTDADIDSDLAWDITTGGVTATNDTIVVCLVEGGGANYNHPDLIGNFWRNYNETDGNGIDDDGNGYTDDFNGWNVGSANDSHSAGSHGTQCYGMIGAKGNNTTGVTGINWNVKVMLVSGFGVTESSVISAYDYPLTMRKLYNQTGGSAGAFVVATSSSWGIDNADPSAYPLWCAFYDSLGAQGILNVAATTNNNADVDAVGDMPTACSSQYMVSVTRTGQTDNQAGGYGLTTIDFGAPGINVYTTTGSNSYTSTTGTSFSCPLTAGTIALMYSVPCAQFMNLVNNNPSSGAEYVLQVLLNNVDPISAMSGISVTGGRLNAFGAVNYMDVNCLSSGITEASGNSPEIVLFPNPVTDEITFNMPADFFENGNEFRLIICNPAGQEILCTKMKLPSERINIKTIDSGFYFYKITSPVYGLIKTGTLIKI